MFYLPIGFRFNNKKVLIIGGGMIAYRKAELLKKADAEITVLARNFIEQWNGFAVPTVQKEFCETDLEGFDFVIAATDDRALNKKIGALCRARGIYVNVADTKYESDFVTMALIEYKEIVLSLFSDAKNPKLVSEVKKYLEAAL